MKAYSHIILICTLSALMVACGADNKSGKSNTNDFGYNSTLTGGVSSSISYNGYSINQVLAENTCSGGINQRQEGQPQPVNIGGVIPSGDIYVGVTSFGDVGVLVGNGTAQPTFVGYYCIRNSYYAQQSSVISTYVRSMSLGAYTYCQFKPIAAATVQLPDGSVANFRMLDYGSSRGTKFTFCQ